MPVGSGFFFLAPPNQELCSSVATSQEVIPLNQPLCCPFELPPELPAFSFSSTGVLYVFDGSPCSARMHQVLAATPPKPTIDLRNGKASSA